MNHNFLKTLMLILLCVAQCVQAQAEKEPSLKDFIKPPTIDEFNDQVSPEDRVQPSLQPGGRLILRMVGEPNSLNPLTDNSSTSQEIVGMLFDSLIIRHTETFEYLPWMAKYWETRDWIQLTDGTRIEGVITGQDNDSVTIIENEGILLFGKQDIVQYDTEKGIIQLNDGRTFTGSLKEYIYSVEYTPHKKDNLKTVPAKQIAVMESDPAKKAIVRNSIYYFTLRSGITWHDGQPVTVQDIAFSYDTVKNRYVDAAPLRNYFNDIDKFDVIDEDTVKFTYKKSYFKSFSVCGGITILPKHIYNPDQFGGDEETFGNYFNTHSANRQPLGNGAFKFIRWIKGREIVLERIDSYWAQQCGFPYLPKGKPYLQQIVWTIISNNNAALKELQNGNVDADFNVEPEIWFSDQTNTADFTGQFARAHITIPMYTYIGWNMDSVYFKDKRVRQAMTHLIPREKIAGTIHRGLVTPVTGPFSINDPAYDHSLKPYEWSVRKAKKLLREAGWLDHDGDGIIDKDGIPFRFDYLIHGGREYHQKIADIIKESVEQAGIVMNIRKLDWTVLTETISDRKFDAVRMAWGTGIDGDPYQIWHSSQAENRGSNYVGFRNEQADKIIETARETFDPIKRWELLRQLHVILYDEQPYTFLFNFKMLFFYNKKFRNVKLYSVRPGYDLYDWYIHKPYEE
ncbi:MAG: ABC transporter substrate-binding protein [Candidatus Auribacterota bacterium]|jgi:peptide/nickel transport system substrate-binding protein|nr:ABC transporter substrate-binding protein [Candidatus Auribacterota bacterium]